MPMNSHREFNGKHCGKKIPYNSMTSHVTKCIGEKTQKVIWKFMWLTKIVQLCATAVTKPWKMQFFLDRQMASVYSVQMQFVKTSEGHIVLFQSARGHIPYKKTHMCRKKLKAIHKIAQLSQMQRRWLWW